MGAIIPIANTGDLALSNRRLSAVERRPEYVLAQRIYTRLYMPRGTWFLNRRSGFPWDLVLGAKAPSLATVRTIFVEYFLQIPGLRELESLTVQPPDSARALRVDFVAFADSDVPVSGLSPILVDGVAAFPSPIPITVAGGGFELGA